MMKQLKLINQEGTNKLDTYQMVRKLIRNRPEPEIFTLDCPTQRVLDIIGNKWSASIFKIKQKYYKIGNTYCTPNNFSISYPSSFIPHPSSLIPHPSSFI